MKSLFSLLLVCLSFLLSAQSPQTISYQAILRDNVGVLIQNAGNVSIKVSIIQGALIENNIIYEENHSTTTNANGLFTIEIGNGNTVLGDYPAIQWGAGPFFLKTEIDPNGGTNYLITAITELLSVPFANYAYVAGRRPGVAGLLEGHWVPTQDEIFEEGFPIFFQYLNNNSAILYYFDSFIDQNGNLNEEWYFEIIIANEGALTNPFGEGLINFTVTEDELILSLDDGGVIYTSIYARQ